MKGRDIQRDRVCGCVCKLCEKEGRARVTESFDVCVGYLKGRERETEMVYVCE